MPLSSRFFLPKEELGEFQYWQPAAFANTRETEANAEARAGRARAQGFEEGKREGYAAGNQMASAQARQLAALLDAVGCELRVLGEQTARETLRLAIAIAQQITRRELTLNPKTVVPLVTEAMNCLPQGTRSARLSLHPGDALLVSQHLGEELTRLEWRIVEDPTLTPGECRINAACGDVDATFETRWARVLAALGQDDAGLKP
jgi:flagellar assembly protein FliH